jgi:polyphosphate kinase
MIQRPASALASALSLTTVLALGPAPQAAAHPHVFVETGLELLHGPDGRLEAVRVTWTYDELFSLLLLEDLGLDSDFDGTLTPEEEARLQGFDMDWPDDYEGDLYLSVAGAPMALSAPEPGPARLDADGRLVSSHVRRLDRPVNGAAQEVVLRAYDPYFYTAYEIMTDRVATDGPRCHVEVYTPDLDAAYAALEAALNELMGQAQDADAEVDFPPVGDRFAEELRLACAGGS